MKLDFANGLRVLAGLVMATALHGCNDSANSVSRNDATLTVSIPQASSTNKIAARAAPDYIKTILIEVLDDAQNIMASREVPASGGQLALTVPANLALHVKGAALDQDRHERFSGNKAVPPIAAGTTATVSLTLDALTPLSASVQAAELNTLTVSDNTTNVTVITTNAQADQHLRFEISGGADRRFFAIDASSGQLSFLTAPSFNTPQDTNNDNVYEVQVSFSDGFESVTQDLKVTVVSPGSLDISFGTNGMVTTDIGIPTPGTSDWATGVAVQRDGKIVVAGSTYAANTTSSAVVRYTTAGTLDTTFGTKGIVTLSGAINALALTRSDDIIVAGTVTNTVGNTDFLLASIDKDGKAESANNWNVTTDLASGSNDRATALAIQADGRIEVVGDRAYTTASGGGSTSFAVARYDNRGNLDITFGTNGIVLTGITGSTNNHAAAVALQGDTLATSGKIVVAGYGNFQTTGTDFVIVRYDNVGRLDSSFNSTGIVTTDFGTNFNDSARGVLIQPDGKIVAAGESNLSSALARYNNDGTLDGKFGPNGNGLAIDVTSSFISAIALQLDEKFVVAVNNCGDGCGGFQPARYQPDGSVDTSFALNGYRNNQAYALALQTDGKILVAGGSYGASGYDFVVKRYNP